MMDSGDNKIFGFWSQTEDSATKEMATTMKKTYDAFVGVGFTEAQAMEIITTMIAAAAAKNN